MFWNVQISNRSRDMEELCQALADFFAYAAGYPGNQLDPDDFTLARPQNAPWLLEQFTGGEENRKGLKRAVEKLFQLPVDRRQALAEAVAHDMAFHQAASPSSFYFMTPLLDKEEQDILSNFFSYFYRPAFDRATPPQLNGHDCPATRKELRRDYFQLNPTLEYVCPVCLQRKYDAGEEDDLDHHFPQKHYPVLSVHPWNLMFICKDCNMRYKGFRDPLAQGGQTAGKPLDAVFRPYQDTVKDHAALTFQWVDAKSADQVKLLPAQGGTGEAEKLEGFDRLFHLEERWTHGLKHLYNCLRRRYSGRGLSKDELRRKLEEKCQDLQWELDAAPEQFLEAEYTAWLCEERLDDFYKSLQQ